MASTVEVQKSSPGVVAALPLRRNIAWTFAGNVVFAGSQWGMLTVLAKTGSAAMVGEFTLALAVTTPVMLLANLGLRGVIATDARREHEFADCVTLSSITTVLGFAVIAAIAVLMPACRAIAFVVLAVGVVKAFEMFSELVYGLLQQHERMDRIAILQGAKGVTTLVALALAIWFSGSLLIAAVTLCGVRALWLICGDLPSAAWVQRHPTAPFRFPWNAAELKNLAVLALPVGTSLFLANLQLNVPRYFIVECLDERALGIFAAMAYLVVAGSIVNGAVSHSMLPRLAQYHATRDLRSFARLLAKGLAVSAMIGLVAVAAAALAGRAILTFLYTAEFAEHLDVFVCLSVAFGLEMISATLCNAVRAMRRFKPICILSVGSLVAQCVLCLVLIPGYGLQGAAWSVTANTFFNVLAYGSILVVATRPRGAG